MKTLTLFCLLLPVIAFGQAKNFQPRVAATNSFGTGGGGASAILFDTVATNTQPFGTALTVPITVGNNANRVVLAALLVDNTTSVGLTGTPSCGGNAMTFLTNVLASATSQQIEVYYLIAPATGAQNVIWGWNNTGPASSIVLSYYNVNQTTPVDITPSPQIDNGSDVTVSSTVTTGASGDLVVDFVCVNSGVTLTPGAGQTARFNNQVNTADATISASDKDSAASVTMTWSWSGAQRTAQVACNLNVP